MKQEAPWRPPTRTKCFDELMYSGLRGQEGMEEKKLVYKKKEKGKKCGCGAVCVCVCTFKDVCQGVSRQIHHNTHTTTEK